MTPLQHIAAATRAALGTYIPGDDYYPHGLTGLRGSHDGSFEVAHLLGREGARFKLPETVEEEYDLVVVGAGISGLAALPWEGAVALIAISMVLTFIAGLIPARLAAKKDPVVALRSE